MRYRAGSPNVIRPTANKFSSGCGHGEPRSDAGSFTTCVRELDGNLLVLGVGKLNYLAEAFNVRIVPEPDVLWGDAPLWYDSRCFDKCETGTSSEDPANCSIESRQYARGERNGIRWARCQGVT